MNVLMLTKFNLNSFLLKATNLAFPFSTHYRYTTIKILKGWDTISTQPCVLMLQVRGLLLFPAYRPYVITS